MRQKSVMASGGYYVATHILTVWKRLAGLAPDQPHGWSFPDEVDLQSPGEFQAHFILVAA
jgi:hypothetical protein